MLKAVYITNWLCIPCDGLYNFLSSILWILLELLLSLVIDFQILLGVFLLREYKLVSGNLKIVFPRRTEMPRNENNGENNVGVFRTNAEQLTWESKQFFFSKHFVFHSMSMVAHAISNSKYDIYIYMYDTTQWNLYVVMITDKKLRRKLNIFAVEREIKVIQ